MKIYAQYFTIIYVRGDYRNTVGTLILNQRPQNKCYCRSSLYINVQVNFKVEFPLKKLCIKILSIIMKNIFK